MIDIDTIALSCLSRTIFGIEIRSASVDALAIDSKDFAVIPAELPNPNPDQLGNMIIELERLKHVSEIRVLFKGLLHQLDKFDGRVISRPAWTVRQRPQQDKMSDSLGVKVWIIEPSV
jgi:hypothetical protein